MEGARGCHKGEGGEVRLSDEEGGAPCAPSTSACGSSIRVAHRLQPHACALTLRFVEARTPGGRARIDGGTSRGEVEASGRRKTPKARRLRPARRAGLAPTLGLALHSTFPDRHINTTQRDASVTSSTRLTLVHDSRLSTRDATTRPEALDSTSLPSSSLPVCTP